MFFFPVQYEHWLQSEIMSLRAQLQFSDRVIEEKEAEINEQVS